MPVLVEIKCYLFFLWFRPTAEQYCAPCVEDLNYDDAMTEDAPTLRPELREIAKIGETLHHSHQLF